MLLKVTSILPGEEVKRERCPDGHLLSLPCSCHPIVSHPHTLPPKHWFQGSFGVRVLKYYTHFVLVAVLHRQHKARGFFFFFSDLVKLTLISK